MEVKMPYVKTNGSWWHNARSDHGRLFLVAFG